MTKEQTIAILAYDAMKDGCNYPNLETALSVAYDAGVNSAFCLKKCIHCSGEGKRYSAFAKIVECEWCNGRGYIKVLKDESFN